jgi:hypothetical protein
LLLVIEASGDGKQIRCKICKSGGWLKKDSLQGHVKSEAHQRSVNAQADMQVIQTAREQAMQLEAAHEESLEFAQLLQSGRPVAATAPRIPKPSAEEQEMWGNYATAEKTFDAGLDPSLAAAEERKGLEKAATDSYLWSAVDNLPNEVQIDNELLLDELEQFDIVNEILQDARTYLYHPAVLLDVNHLFNYYRFGLS